jgi:hypothetical protein
MEAVALPPLCQEGKLYVVRTKVADLIENIPVYGPRFRQAARSIARWRERRRLTGRSTEEIFSTYYQNNTWGNRESRSGHGSSLQSTASLRAHLPVLWRELGVRTILDIPCGDFVWMGQVDLSGFTYVGADIVEAVVRQNAANHSRPGVSFQRLDLIRDALPPADLIFCRDCLVHFSFSDLARALANIRNSGAQWLMTTHFPETGVNNDIATGQWRPINLQNAPCAFPPPRASITEASDASATAHWPDKSLAVWRVSELPSQLALEA